MTRRKSRYSHYVVHPRFGQGPSLTGLDPAESDTAYFHWHSGEGIRVPNTAIVADVSRQAPATIHVTHYFDAKRVCVDCERPFLFFAEEQKHWYEELGFGLDSDCVRCVPCRKNAQGLAYHRQRYEELFHLSDRTAEQNLEMAECCLALVEAKVFHPRSLERVRRLIRSSESFAPDDLEPRLAALRDRVASLEQKTGPSDPD